MLQWLQMKPLNGLPIKPAIPIVDDSQTAIFASIPWCLKTKADRTLTIS